MQLPYVSPHVPLRVQFFYSSPPPLPRLFKASCLCKWTGGSHIWVTRLLEVIERLQNGACLILPFQKFSHMYSRQLCLLNEFIKFQKSFENSGTPKNVLNSFISSNAFLKMLKSSEVLGTGARLPATWHRQDVCPAPVTSRRS